MEKKTSWEIMGTAWKDNFKTSKRIIMETCLKKDEAQERMEELMNSGLLVHAELWSSKEKDGELIRKRHFIVDYNRHGEMSNFEKETE
jgi:hypothetical protein